MYASESGNTNPTNMLIRTILTKLGQLIPYETPTHVQKKSPKGPVWLPRK